MCFRYSMRRQENAKLHVDLNSFFNPEERTALTPHPTFFCSEFWLCFSTGSNVSHQDSSEIGEDVARIVDLASENWRRGHCFCNYNLCDTNQINKLKLYLKVLCNSASWIFKFSLKAAGLSPHSWLFPRPRRAENSERSGLGAPDDEYMEQINRIATKMILTDVVTCVIVSDVVKRLVSAYWPN